MRTGLIAGAGVLIVVLIFIIQNAHAVTISFLGAHLRLSLAVALLFAVLAGALIMVAAGTARITQLRTIIRRDRRRRPPAPADTPAPAPAPAVPGR
jgi:putative membrane protein